MFAISTSSSAASWRTTFSSAPIIAAIAPFVAAQASSINSPRRCTSFRPLAKSKAPAATDRKSTRLNSSHSQISYAVFCLKKKNKLKYAHVRSLCFVRLQPVASPVLDIAMVSALPALDVLEPDALHLLMADAPTVDLVHDS